MQLEGKYVIQTRIALFCLLIVPTPSNAFGLPVFHRSVYNPETSLAHFKSLPKVIFSYYSCTALLPLTFVNR